jgi:hypothetical protein
MPVSARFALSATRPSEDLRLAAILNRFGVFVTATAWGAILKIIQNGFTLLTRSAASCHIGRMEDDQRWTAETRVSSAGIHATPTDLWYTVIDRRRRT